MNISATTARTIASARFGDAPKMKISKIEYMDVMRAVYLLAQTNTAKDIRESIKISDDDVSLDHIMGDIEIMIMESHNELATKTKYGRLSFNTMDLEDLIYERPMSKIIKKNMSIK